jgi:hypothetical protein
LGVKNLDRVLVENVTCIPNNCAPIKTYRLGVLNRELWTRTEIRIHEKGPSVVLNRAISRADLTIIGVGFRSTGSHSPSKGFVKPSPV